MQPFDLNRLRGYNGSEGVSALHVQFVNYISILVQRRNKLVAALPVTGGKEYIVAQCGLFDIASNEERSK